MGEAAISQNTTSSTWQRDFCFSHQAVVYVPHPEGALATNSSKQGQLFAVPSASGSMGSAHCPQNGGEGDRLGAPGPHERRKVKVRAVAGLLDLPGSVSKEHHFFFFLRKKIFYILKKTKNKSYAPTVNSCCLCRSPGAPGDTLEMTVPGDRKHSSVPSTGSPFPPQLLGLAHSPRGLGWRDRKSVV